MAAGGFFAIWVVVKCLREGILPQRTRSIDRSENPFLFWLGIGWISLAGIGFFAAAILIWANDGALSQ